MTQPLSILPLLSLPEVQPHADLGLLIVEALNRLWLQLTATDILVVTQKIVSKAEDRFVDLEQVTPSHRARELAAQTRKDPRLVEVILSESTKVLRVGPQTLIVEDRRGLICANAGVDQSNVSERPGVVLRLPEDPDRSARRIRKRLGELLGIQLPVLIIDSQGRPWREGTVGVAIGIAGLAPVLDLRGRPDSYGRKLRITTVGFADQIAAAATLVMGQANERIPVVIVRGLAFRADEKACAHDALRPPERDLFR